MRKFPYYQKQLTTITETAKNNNYHNQQLIKLNRQLAGYTHSTQYQNALRLFDEIRTCHLHLRLDSYTLSTTLTACANLRNTTFGNKIHSHAIKSGLQNNTHVANTLLSLYVKARDTDSVKLVFDEIENPDVYSYTTLLSGCCKMGHVGYARQVFDEMPDKDVAVWNAMITGCLDCANEEIGFRLFRDMCRFGVRHDNYSFASVLSACYEELVDFGKQVHSLVVKTGYLVMSSVVNALITMYFNSENVVDAYLVFQESEDSVRDGITYNVMVDGLVSVGRVEEAFVMLSEMILTRLRPTELTFLSFMSSCTDARVGFQVHALAVKMGVGASTSVSNAAMTMYSGCGDLHAASMIFERLEEKDLVSWNTMISAYAQSNFGRLAVDLYLEMQRAGAQPDEFTFGSLLASSELIKIVEVIHSLVHKKGVISNIQVSNALVCAYSKHGTMKRASQIFYNMSNKNLISWNSIISGLQLNGFPIQGLEKFTELLMTELRPNIYTLTIVLSICGSISALQHGKQVHGYILRFGFSPKGSLGNALVTMYGKCGALDWSMTVFNEMTERELVSWNALISAFAQHGKGKDAVHCFQTMQCSSQVKPDRATFTALLSACSHSGLVDDGIKIFNSMVDKYGVLPEVDHFSCITDLLGRSGNFDDIEKIINSDHFEAHPSIWWTLISACAAHGNLRLGRLAAGFLLETEQDSSSVYVHLSNIYAAAGQWEEASKIRRLMECSGAIKQPGFSWLST